MEYGNQSSSLSILLDIIDLNNNEMTNSTLLLVSIDSFDKKDEFFLINKTMEIPFLTKIICDEGFFYDLSN
jgi:hypothetical protein